MPLEVVVTWLERALGEEAMALPHKQLDFWQRAGLDDVTEEWRQRQVKRLFCQLGLAMQLGFAA